MQTLIVSVIWLILQVINLYMFVLIAYCVLTLLASFNVVNARNQLVGTLLRIGFALTEPVLRPIRRFMPNMGGIDLSPVVAILLLGFVQRLVIGYSFGG